MHLRQQDRLRRRRRQQPRRRGRSPTRSTRRREATTTRRRPRRGSSPPTTRPPDAQIVHSLEHGYIAIWYRPDIGPAQLGDLQGLANRYHQGRPPGAPGVARPTRRWRRRPGIAGSCASAPTSRPWSGSSPATETRARRRSPTDARDWRHADGCGRVWLVVGALVGLVGSACSDGGPSEIERTAASIAFAASSTTATPATAATTAHDPAGHDHRRPRRSPRPPRRPGPPPTTRPRRPRHRRPWGRGGRAGAQRSTPCTTTWATVDDLYDQNTAYGVMAFQKVNGMARTGRATDDVIAALATATPPPALVPNGGAQTGSRSTSPARSCSSTRPTRCRRS